jgi:retinol-binding protein 3
MRNLMAAAPAALISASVLLLALPEHGTGQANDSMSARVRAEAVESVAAIMERHYPWPDTARMIAAHLRTRLHARDYDSIATLDGLARALSRDVRAINGDLHLSVGAGPPPAPPAGVPAVGFDRVERLDGNVGYLRMRMIAGSREAFAAVADALRSLDGTAAVILDLRGVPGGSAGMANFLISHFIPPGVASLGVDYPATGRTEIRHSLATVPGPRRTTVPLYVLVDRRSASAAEDIPFVLQNLGRALIVGERTAGAGRNVARYPAAHGLSVGVSNSRVYDPASGREWERIGVAPDITVPSEGALDAALDHVLRRGGSSTTHDSATALFDWR